MKTRVQRRKKLDSERIEETNETEIQVNYKRKMDENKKSEGEGDDREMNREMNINDEYEICMNELVYVENMFLKLLDTTIEEKKHLQHLTERLCKVEKCLLIVSVCLIVIFTSHICTSYYFGQIL